MGRRKKEQEEAEKREEKKKKRKKHWQEFGGLGPSYTTGGNGKWSARFGKSHCKSRHKLSHDRRLSSAYPAERNENARPHKGWRVHVAVSLTHESTNVLQAFHLANEIW